MANNEEDRETLSNSKQEHPSSSPELSLPERLDRIFTPYLTPANVQMIQESCPVQVVVHGVMGFGFGGMLGLFLSGIGPSMAVNEATQSSLNKETVKGIFKEMGSKTWSSAKNLGLVAALFSGVECTLESYRAKHDIYNTAMAGCISGGILGAKAGPKAALYGCGGFAAFSVAIECFLQR